MLEPDELTASERNGFLAVETSDNTYKLTLAHYEPLMLQLRKRRRGEAGWDPFYEAEGPHGEGVTLELADCRNIVTWTPQALARARTDQAKLDEREREERLRGEG